MACRRNNKRRATHHLRSHHFKTGSHVRSRRHPALGHDVHRSYRCTCSSSVPPFGHPSFSDTLYQETKDKKTDAPEPEEFQNPLTKKFTDAEWKALKLLRVCRHYYRSIAVLTQVSIQTKLPYIFETSFPEKKNKLSPVTLWGVSIDPSNPVGDARVSVILVKFLRARCVYTSVNSGSLSDKRQGAERGKRDQHDDLDVQVA